MKIFIISFFVIASIISCKKATDTTLKKTETTTEEHKVAHSDWSYTGEGRPENWAQLNEAFKDCAGNEQSPININVTNVIHAQIDYNLNITYATSSTAIINNGHTIQYNINEGSSLNFDDRTYQLLQFHMHSLSEHTINSSYAPLEVHFVNKAADNNYAVVGVLFEEGTANPFLATYIDQFPSEVGEYKDETSFNINEFLPKSTSYYHYKGSFTTPPCSEIVEWIVLKEKLTASKEQLDKLSKLLDNNYRPIQPKNGRIIDSQ